MKNPIFFLIFFSQILFGQNKTFYNVKDYGIIGDGTTDVSLKINNLIKDIDGKIQKTKVKHTLFFPEGIYILNSPIIAPKLLDIEGETNRGTVLMVKKRNTTAIVLDNRETDQKLNTLDYNIIQNLSIYGPDYNVNPFAWKNLSETTDNSIGIKILGIRNRVRNCVIDGFLNSGIQVSSSYYNYVSENFIKNNKFGIDIKDTSTSTFISSNEFRANAIAIYIRNNSYSTFITNNMIEANIANFLDAETGEDDPVLLKKGKGVAIENSFMNFVNNNYFELQFVNIALKNSSDNDISNNFFAIGTDQSYKGNVPQTVVKFFNTEKNNRIYANKILSPKDSIEKFNIQISNKEANLSSNIVDFEQNNDQLKISNEKKFPAGKFKKLSLPQTSRK